MDQEERIIRLEELAYFQEERLRELSEALTAQQQQIDMLEHRLVETMELARNLRDQLGQTGNGAPVNDLPPHYMPERY